MSIKIYKSENIYLSSFLVSQENFSLGKIYIEESNSHNPKATIEIEYESDLQDLLDNYITVYDDKKAICKLHAYQENIRFIMHIVNKRKSGILD